MTWAGLITKLIMAAAFGNAVEVPLPQPPLPAAETLHRRR